jgi:hypothetical protein
MSLATVEQTVSMVSRILASFGLQPNRSPPVSAALDVLVDMLRGFVLR